MRREITNNRKANLGSFAISLGLVALFIGNGSSLNLADNFIFFFGAIIIGVSRIVLNSFRLKVDNKFLMCFFCGMFLLSLFGWMISPYADPGTAKTMIMYSLLFIVILGTNQTEIDIIIMEYGAIISSIIFSILVLFFGNYYLSIGTGKYTYIQTFGNNIIFEPNYLALFISLGFEISVVLIVNYISQKKRIKAVLLGLAAVIQLLAMLRTGSRMVLVAIAIFGFTYIAFMKNNKLKRKIFMVSLVMVVLLLISIRIGILPETMVNRLFHTSYADNSNLKRLYDWLSGIKVMFSNPLGYGPSLTTGIIEKIVGFQGDAHNTFITIGIYYGFIGFISFISLWIITMGRLLFIKEYGYFAMIISMFFQANILSVQCTITIWIFLLLCFLKINTNQETNKG